MFPSTEIVTRPENPTRAMREARQHERQARVTRDAVIAALQQLILDTTSDRTNALTRALDDVLAHPPEDRWELDGLIKWLPYRYRVDVGGAVVRLIGEAWLHVAGADEQPF
jgi:hypothetical protein